MNDSFSDELISAYLDGELTPDEQSAVEQALVESAEYRQMFDELRALRGSLQSLPSERLAADFSQRVIRRAAEVLKQDALQHEASPRSESGPEQPAASAVSLPGDSAPAVSLPPSSPAWRMWVPVVSVAAAAAALLMVFVLPKIEGGRVAGGSDRLKQLADAAAPSKPGLKEPYNRKAGDEAVRRLPIGTGSEGAYSKGTDSEGVDRAEVKTTAGLSATSKPAPEGIENAAQNQREYRADFAKELKADATASDPRSGAAASSGASDSENRRTESFGALPSVVAESKQLQQTAVGQVNELTAGLAKDAEAPGLKVYRINATREALESGAFDKLLARQNIRFDDAAGDAGLFDLAAKDGLEEGAEVRRQSRQLAERVSADGVDVVVVDATVAQIDAVLADLRLQDARFPEFAGQTLAVDESTRLLRAPEDRKAKHLADRVDSHDLSLMPADLSREREGKPSDAPASRYAAPATAPAPGIAGPRQAGGAPAAPAAGTPRTASPAPGGPAQAGVVPPSPAPSGSGLAGSGAGGGVSGGGRGGGYGGGGGRPTATPRGFSDKRGSEKELGEGFEKGLEKGQAAKPATKDGQAKEEQSKQEPSEEALHSKLKSSGPDAANGEAAGRDVAVRETLGRASRIVPPSFRQKQTDRDQQESLDDSDAQVLRQNSERRLRGAISPSAAPRAAVKLQQEEAPAGKTAAKKTEAKQDSSTAGNPPGGQPAGGSAGGSKSAGEKSDADKWGDGKPGDRKPADKAPGQNGSYAYPEKSRDFSAREVEKLHKKYADSPERIRVLFVIRAVDQEPALPAEPK